MLPKASAGSLSSRKPQDHALYPAADPRRKLQVGRTLIHGTWRNRLQGELSAVNFVANRSYEGAQETSVSNAVNGLKDHPVQIHIDTFNF